MGTGYIRQDTANNIAPNKIASATDIDDEFNAVQDAFDEVTGHTHDGTTAEGAPIEVTGPNQEYVSTANALYPKTDDTYDLGTTDNQWKDLYLDGVAYVDSLQVDTLEDSVDATKKLAFDLSGIGTATTRTLTVPDATDTLALLAEAQTLTNKTIDSASNALTVDLSEATVTGTLAEFNTAVSDATLASLAGTETLTNKTLALGSNTVSGTLAQFNTAVTDATLASLAGTETLTNKTLTSPDINTPDIDGGTIDSTVIGGTTAAAGSFTTLNASGDVTFDTDGFFFDQSAGRVGVGTSTPQSTLSVQSATEPDGSILGVHGANDGTARGLIIGLADGSAGARNSSVIYNAIDEGIGQAQHIWQLDSSEAMRIDASSNVGIGTTSPDSLLHMAASIGPELRIENTDAILSEGQVTGSITFEQNDNTSGGAGITGRIQMRSTDRPDTGSYFGNVADMDFLVSGLSTGLASDNATNTAMTIQAGTGNVGVGTSSPGELLTVSGGDIISTGDLRNQSLIIERTDAANDYQFRIEGFSSADTQSLRFIDNKGGANSERMRINSSGDVGIGTSSPSIRLDVEDSGANTAGSTIDLARFSNNVNAADTEASLAIRQNNANAARLTSIRESTANNYSLQLVTYANNVATDGLLIDSSGNVGIGTTSPSTTLNIYDNTNATSTKLRIENGDTVIDDGQDVNSIQFYTNDASANGTGVTGEIVQVAENPGSAYGLSFRTYTGGTLSDIMRIDAEGQVGIGTDSPTVPLTTVLGDGTRPTFGTGTVAAFANNDDAGDLARVSIVSGSTGYAQLEFGDFSDQDLGIVRYDHSGNSMSFFTLSSEAMRIDSSGNLLVGTTSSSFGGGAGVRISDNGLIDARRDGDVSIRCNRLNTAGQTVRFAFDGAEVGSISVTNSATTYNTSSGRHLKDNITSFEQDPGAMIDALKPSSFNWLSDGKRANGFIADEFEEVFPSAVSYDDENRAASIDASTPEVIATLVAEIQSLRKRITKLES